MLFQAVDKIPQVNTGKTQILLINLGSVTDSKKCLALVHSGH